MMMKDVKGLLEQAAAKAFPGMEAPIEITPATQEKFGHYQCNSAMKFAGKLGKKPREIAESLVQHIEDREGMLCNTEIAGPGFINLTLSPEWLSKRLDVVAKDSRLGIPLPKKKQKIVVEFSSPNIAKEMHVGHLRSTIIGDAIARLFEFLGHDVVRLNHVGDWGTAFGMLIAYMKEEVPEVLSEGQQTDLPSLMAWYRASKKRFDEDESFKTRARQEVVKLQGGDTEALKAWDIICDISRKAFQEVYDVLGVQLEERGESFYNPMLPQIVSDLEKKGLITVSEGAKCVFHEKHKIPLMVQKSDGGYGYDATDMAAMLHRVEEEKADRIIVITDAGQGLHFSLIRETCLKAGYLDPKRVRFDHVPFGLVLGSDGKKFRTRAGETEKLVDLLEAAVKEARRLLEERGTEAEIDVLAPILGIDAVKYADLSCNRITDYQFSYERMLKFEGNTATFILYSYVRVAGIKRKVGNAEPKGPIVLEHPSEIELGVHLLRFGDVLLAMTEDLMPNGLTDYLYTLAQKFNAFFRDCRVEGVAEQDRRLLLCETVARTMAQGLHLLGLQTTDRM